MKRNSAITIAALLMAPVFLFTGCLQSLKDFGRHMGGPTGSLDATANEKCIAAFNAIKQKDEDKLRELFAGNTADGNEINKLVRSIHGDITDSTQSGGPLSVHFGFSTEDYHMFHKEFKNVKTSEGDEYEIRMIACAASKYDDDDIGVQYIALYCGGDIICRAGGLIERYDEQKVPKELSEVDFGEKSYGNGAEAYCNNLLYYLKNGDEDGFVSLFCEKYKSVAGDSFEEIMEEIGDIESISRIDKLAQGEWKDDHWENLDGDVSIFDIVNSDGERFEIRMNVVFANEYDKDRVGIHYFQIQESGDELNEYYEHDAFWILQFGMAVG